MGALVFIDRMAPAWGMMISQSSRERFAAALT